MFPFLLALLFILKIRLGVQSNILEFIKKRYGGEGKKLFRTYEADDANCFYQNVLLNIAAHQDVSISPCSSIYFEDSPRHSIEYFRSHQETLRRGGQEIIQNI